MNLKDNVKVKLTKFGQQVYVDQFYPEFPVNKVEGNELIIPLDELMYIFGDYMYVNAISVFASNELKMIDGKEIG